MLSNEPRKIDVRWMIAQAVETQPMTTIYFCRSSKISLTGTRVRAVSQSAEAAMRIGARDAPAAVEMAAAKGLQS